MVYDNSLTNIVVVDDEEYVCNLIVEALAQEKYQVAAFTDPAAALEHIEHNRIDLVLTDLVMGERSGVEIIDAVRETHPDAVILLMTAHPTVETAISVLKKGVYDFLVKPFKLDILRATIKRGLEHQRILRENLHLRGQVEFLKVVAEGGADRDIESFLKEVARSCQQELAAAAVGILEIDPKTKDVIHSVQGNNDPKYNDDVLASDTIERFAFTRGRRPIIRTTLLSDNPKKSTKVTISQPVFFRSRLHGVINIVVISRFDPVTPGQLSLLAILANTTAYAIANNRLNNDLQSMYLHAIKGLANAIEARDSYTAGHTERVSKLAEVLARRLGWKESRVRHLQMGCTLHDIGKIGVPDSILNKPGRLSPEEADMMRSHPEVGLKIIRRIELFKPAVPYIASHHEHYDGTGYPRGLKGDAIPIEGRLLAICDTFDAILSDRPYRKGRPVSSAVQELLDNRGKQFDPLLVDLFVELIKEGKIDCSGMYGLELDVDEINELQTTSQTVSV